MAKNHNLRQRKKLHIGEFRELGFSVVAAVREGVSDSDAEKTCDAFIADCIEANGLLYGGAIGDKIDGFVVAEADRASATEGHREAVRAWLGATTELSAIKVGPLVDAWYGHD